MDYLSIGSGPCEEACVQVSSDLTAMKAECWRFINLIRKHLGPEPEGARLKVKSFPHDFGSYLEVVCFYDENNEAASDYALKCESDAPANWDLDEAMVRAIVPGAHAVWANPDGTYEAYVKELCAEASKRIASHKYCAGMEAHGDFIAIRFK